VLSSGSGARLGIMVASRTIRIAPLDDAVDQLAAQALVLLLVQLTPGVLLGQLAKLGLVH